MESRILVRENAAGGVVWHLEKVSDRGLGVLKKCDLRDAVLSNVKFQDEARG
jgi:hypothetical protein